MSAISSSTGQSLATFFQSVSVQASSSTATASATTTSTTGQSVQAAGGHHHHPDGNGGKMFQALQSAVTSALQSAQSSGSTDPNTTIENAISQFFKSHGGAPPASGSNQAQGSQPPSGNADGDQDSSTSAQGSSTDAAKSAFFATLQQYGVSSDQFRQDFLAAIKDAQNGTVNSGTALQSVPSGTVVDTTA